MAFQMQKAIFGPQPPKEKIELHGLRSGEEAPLIIESERNREWVSVRLGDVQRIVRAATLLNAVKACSDNHAGIRIP